MFEVLGKLTNRLGNSCCIVVALLCACLAFTCGCQEDIDYEDYLRASVMSGDCPGYVAYTFELGHEDWSCFGWADVESSRPMEVKTVFRICSMTKSFVGALAAVLSDSGKIDLDEQISHTFPEFSGEKSSITLRQCLSMTAGFPALSPSMTQKGLNAQDPVDIALEMAALPLKAPPGTKFIYSNPSYEIAAAVIERKTGRKLEELLDEVFFRPLGMTDTTFHPSAELLARTATLYQMHDTGGCSRVESKLVRPPFEGADSHVSASGGLFSTPLDMMEFYQMLNCRGLAEDGRRVMTEGAIELISTKQTPPNVEEWYSFGFCKIGDGWIGHGGAHGTVAEFLPSESCVRMIFTQTCGKQAQLFLRKWRKSTAEEYDEVTWTGARFFEDQDDE